jgi:ketosteroid isomerase-like protein
MSDTAQARAVKEIYAALNRNDIPAILSFFDPQIERVEPPGFPASGTYHGLAKVGAHFATARATWAEGTCEPEQLITHGENVVALVHVKVRLKDKSDWIDGRAADVFSFKDGKVTKMLTFLEAADALKWAGVK